MFYGVDMVEKTAKEVQIKDTNTEAFYLLLKYVYTEKFELNKENDYEMAINVFKIAHRFRFERLVFTIEKWFTKMIEKNIDLMQSKCISFREHYKSLKLEPSIEAVIESIVCIYEFAKLYEIVQIINNCRQFLSNPISAVIIIHKKSFLCQSLETMFELLEIMNSSVSQTIIINGLQSILEFKPNTDMRLFESLINLEDCSTEDIKSLRSVKLFSDDLLFEFILNKYNILIRDIEVKDMTISELTFKVENLNAENLDILTEKRSLYDNYFRLKQMFAPLMRGENNVWVNGFNYLRNYSRSRPKSTTNVNFNF
jgi:hypothetical protein